MYICYIYAIYAICYRSGRYIFPVYPFFCTLESCEHQNIQVAANKYIYWIYPNIEIYTPTLCTCMHQPLYFRVFQMEMQVLANWSFEIYKEIMFFTITLHVNDIHKRFVCPFSNNPQ